MRLTRQILTVCLVFLQFPSEQSVAAHKLTVRRKVPATAENLVKPIYFSADGSSCFLLENQGRLREISLPGMSTITERNLNVKCSAFGRWEEGFAIYADATQELIVLDEAFNETGRVKTPGLVGFATAPTLDFGYVIGKNQIGTVYLKKAKLLKLNTTPLLRAAARVKRTERPPAPLGFDRATCTLDGKYLVTMADHRINRFAIKRKGALVWEESGWKIGSSGTPAGLSVGGNPHLVAAPYGTGNSRNLPGHPVSPGYGTFIYDLKKLSVPKVTVTPGAYPEAMGFDGELKLIYAQNFDVDLIVYNHGGAKIAQYELDERNAQAKAFFTHPEGGKLLVLTENSLVWCELPKSVIAKAG